MSEGSRPSPQPAAARIRVPRVAGKIVARVIASPGARAGPQGGRRCGAFVVAWRLAIGMVDLKRTGDASMLIGFPTWVAYAPMVLSFVLLGLAAVFIARDDLRKGVA